MAHIDGLRIDVQGTELKAHLDKRITAGEKLVGKLEKEHAAVAALPEAAGRDRIVRCVPPVEHVIVVIDQLRFIRDHIEDGQTYRLSYEELVDLRMAPLTRVNDGLLMHDISF